MWHIVSAQPTATLITVSNSRQEVHEMKPESWAGGLRGSALHVNSGACLTLKSEAGGKI